VYDSSVMHFLHRDGEGREIGLINTRYTFLPSLS
jgi:hypothetical protein